jgi:hypothetical protein
LLNFNLNLLPGAYTPPEKVLDYLAPSCSSGQCEFSNFTSLGICTQVTNVSNLIDVTRLPDRDWNLNLKDNTTWSASILGYSPLVIPNLQSFNIYTLAQNMSIKLPATNERNLSLSDMFILYSNPPALPARDVTFEAIEVLFYWCTKAFSLSVANGVPYQMQLSSTSVVLDNTATSLDLSTNAKFQHCTTENLGLGCYSKTWGSVTLAPPVGFETENPMVLSELTALGKLSRLRC